MRAFNHVINTGKAFYWGTSEWDADEIAQAWRVADRLGLVGPAMEQPAYNMLTRERVERELAHLVRPDNGGLGLTVFSPLKMGLLSGKYRDGVPAGSRLAQTDVGFVRGFWRETGAEAWEALVRQARRLEPVAERLGLPMGTLALAWVLANPSVSSAITGASSPAQVYENCRAVAAVERLTPDVMAEIDAVLGNKPPAVVARP